LLVQRRHQKVIEERRRSASPPTIGCHRGRGFVSRATSAIRVSARSSSCSENRHYFLEVNPRLQVEQRAKRSPASIS
jgi:biotin carboxylase